jgi:hypothetical protein
MATVRTVDLSDVIGELLQEEQSGLFNTMSTADPYINRAAAELRRPMQEMIVRTQRRASELVALVEQLGGTSRPARVNPEHQYFGYLSIDFLLPKLQEAKRQSIERYQRALQLIPPSEEELRGLIESHLAQHMLEMETLSTAMAHVTTSGRAGSQTPSPAHDPSKAR